MSRSGQKIRPTSGDLGRAIRKLRKERRMTIDALAFAAGMHPTYLSEIERGLGNPTWEKLHDLSRALRAPVSTIVGAAQYEAEVAQQYGRQRLASMSRGCTKTDEIAREPQTPIGGTKNAGHHHP
jgi:transcriptional regulator with XRE-family HTH domain